MTKVPYFYSQEAEGERTQGRALPGDDFGDGELFVAAGNIFTSEMRDYLAQPPIEDILADVCPPAERKRLRRTAQYFPGLYSLLSEYASEYPRTKVLRPSLPFSGRTVSLVAHGLFFSVGAVLRAADAFLTDCTLSAEEGDDEIALRIRSAHPAATEDEVAEAFHLSGRELQVMRALADTSGFSIDLRAGEDAEIVFRIPLTVTDLGSMAARTDALLRRAFFLPRIYFS